MGWDFLDWLLPAWLGLMLVWAGIEDVRTREIANWKNAVIAMAAPLWWWSQGLPLWPGVAQQCALALVVFALFVAAFHFGMMGGGDVKLIGAIALWLPMQPLLWMLMVMSLAGGVVTLAIVIEGRLRKRDVEVPYGVAIAIAGLLALREPVLNQFA